MTARDELRQWQAVPDALAAVDAEGDALERAVRRSVRAVSAGHAAVRLATGAAVVAIAALVPAGAVSPATLALLVLLPVALGEVLAPLADAGALSVRTDAARSAARPAGRAGPPGGGPRRPGPAARAREPLVARPASAPAGAPEPCLRDLDLALRPGERVAVCGPSGSGKSTLASLLVRHLDPVRGRRAARRPRPARRRAGRRTPPGRAGRRRPARLRLQRLRERPPGPARTPPTPRWPTPSAGPAWAPGWSRCPRACTRSWAAPGSPCRVASGPGSAWPAPCWPTPRCWCSTSRRPTSTPPPRARWPTCCWTRGRTGRSCGSPTAPSGSTCVDRVVDAGRCPTVGGPGSGSRRGRVAAPA